MAASLSLQGRELGLAGLGAGGRRRRGQGRTLDVDSGQDPVQGAGQPPGGRSCSALAEPALTEMRAVMEAAAAQRTPNARAEHMLTRLVDLALRHRKLTAMLAADRAIVHLFQTEGTNAELVQRPLALLAGTSPQPAGRINAVLVLTGIASATGGELVGDLDDDTLRRHLVHAGRRILGLRTPRTQTVPTL